MKLNRMAMALLATTACIAQAGVTVTPVLLGYQVSSPAEKQYREKLNYTGTTNAMGVSKSNGLYTGAALGFELTPATQVQVEYGVSNTENNAKDPVTATAGTATTNQRYDVDQRTITANALIGTQQFTGYSDSAFNPYVLVGGGVQHTTVKNQKTYDATAGTTTVTSTQAGTTIAEAKNNKVVNAGIGARTHLGNALSLRTEARGVYNIDRKSIEALGLAGLEVTLGGRNAPKVDVPPVVEPMRVVQPDLVVIPEPPVVVQTPVVAPKPEVVVIDEPVVVRDTDSDMDGVVDRLDACPGTPRNLVVDARGCPVPVNLTEELNVELRVFFDYDKSIVKPQYRQEIAKVADAMRAFPNSTAAIEGHASKDRPKSSAKYNQRLSEARAIAVRNILTGEFGVPTSRVSAIGYGFDRPIAPNNTEEGRAMNRRVYAVIKGDRTTTVNQTNDMR